MRALFVKEFRQGKPLLVFAALMGLLLPAAYAVLGRTLFLYGDLDDPLFLPLLFGFVVVAVPPIIAVMAGSGLFSGEAHADTLPILFALPLSRRSIWAAMVLAALALTAAASVILLVLSRVLVPEALRQLPINAYVVDLVCWTVFLVSVGAFCSSLTRSVLASLALTVLISAAFIVGAAVLVLVYGGPLLGVPSLDVALWCALTSPALLLASACAIARGELLVSWRKWLAIPVAVVGLAVTLPIVVAVGRLGTGYERSDVEMISHAELVDGGRVLSLYTHADATRVPVGRAEFRGELLDRDNTLALTEELASASLPLPRSNYAVGLDVASGKEISAVRYNALNLFTQDYFSIDYSIDGTRAAIFDSPAGLTWGRRRGPSRELRILDTAESRDVYVGAPDVWKWSRWLRPTWSPSGKYLVLCGERPRSRDRSAVYFLDRDGRPTDAPPVKLQGWLWSPVEDVVYGFDHSGALVRVRPTGRARDVIWAPEGVAPTAEEAVAPQPAPQRERGMRAGPSRLREPAYGPRYGTAHTAPGRPREHDSEQRKDERTLMIDSVSPDGQWLVVREIVEERREEADGSTRGYSYPVVRMLRADGGDPLLVWRGGVEVHRWIDQIEWLGDGSAIGLHHGPWDRESYTFPFQLVRWRPGDPEFTPFGPVVEAGIVTTFARRDTGEVILWARTWERQERRFGQPRPEPRLISQELLVVDARGVLRALPLPEALADLALYSNQVIGLDADGRLIMLGGKRWPSEIAEGLIHNRVEALDLDTGEVVQVYP